MIKLTTFDHTHNGIVYKEGLNCDFRASNEGIRICPKEDLEYWTKRKMVWAWDATIPDGKRQTKVNQVVLSNCRKIETLAAELWDTEEKQINAVRSNPHNLRFIPSPSEQVQLVAVCENGLTIKYIQNSSQRVQLAAVQNNSYAIAFIQNPSEHTQLIAIGRNSSVLELIRNPTEFVQLTAVRKDRRLFTLIQNPTDVVRQVAKIF